MSAAQLRAEMHDAAEMRGDAHLSAERATDGAIAAGSRSAVRSKKRPGGKSRLECDCAVWWRCKAGDADGCVSLNMVILRRA